MFPTKHHARKRKMAKARFLFTAIIMAALFTPSLLESAVSTSRNSGIQLKLFEKVGGWNDQRCFNDTEDACPAQNQTLEDGDACTQIGTERTQCDNNELWNEKCYPAVQQYCQWHMPDNCPGRIFECSADLSSPTGASWQFARDGGCGARSDCS